MPETRTVVASAARTASGNSGVIALSRALHQDFGETDVDRIALIVGVTAVGGVSPTLDVVIEWSQDGTNFYAADPADSFAQMTAVGGRAKTFTIKGTSYRVVWTIGGTTPSFTFSVAELAL